MNDQTRNPIEAERDFIAKALSAAERAEKFQRIRRIVATVVAFAFAFWFATRPDSPELGIECTIVIFVGLMLSVALAKILSLINKNTVIVLQAIAALRRQQ